MSDQPLNDPQWLDEFEELANSQLDDGSSCDQVHPIIERWFLKLLQGEPPASRPSIMQAMACLSTEVVNHAPDEMIETVLQHMSEDDLAVWVEHILMVGRAFEIALHKGDLDDL